PAWSFTGEAGASFDCSLTRGGVTVFPAAPCTSPKSFDLTGQPDGTYTFTVVAVDPAGNLSPAATSTYLLDTTPPALSITAAPATPGNSRAPAWSFSGEAGASFDCSLTRGGVTVFPAAPCTSRTGDRRAGQHDGTYTLPVPATYAAGNLGRAT